MPDSKKDQDKVMELVERELRRKPEATAKELFEKAKKTNAAIGKLTLRQFHAKYPLQVKRRSSSKRPKKRRPARRAVKRRPSRRQTRPAPGAEAGREAVRQVLLRFAKDVSAASSKAETIEILANVDRYVDEVLAGL